MLDTEKPVLDFVCISKWCCARKRGSLTHLEAPKAQECMSSNALCYYSSFLAPSSDALCY